MRMTQDNWELSRQSLFNQEKRGQGRLPEGRVTVSCSWSMSLVKKEKEEEPREWTSSPAPSLCGSMHCPPSRPPSPEVSPGEGYACHISLLFIFGVWKDNSGDIISIRPLRSLGMLMLPLLKRCGIIRMLMKTGGKLWRNPLPDAQCCSRLPPLSPSDKLTWSRTTAANT